MREYGSHAWTAYKNLWECYIKTEITAYALIELRRFLQAKVRKYIHILHIDLEDESQNFVAA